MYSFVTISRIERAQAIDNHRHMAMEKNPFGRGTFATLPQQITTKGLVSEKTWILGNVVRVRQKKPAIIELSIIRALCIGYLRHQRFCLASD